MSPQDFQWKKTLKELKPPPEKKFHPILMYKGSTTNLLNHFESFKIEVLSEKWVNLDNYNFWERNVIIKCLDEKIMEATTLIPEKTFNGFRKDFLNLDNAPIGKILFNKKNKWKRSDFIFSQSTNKENFDNKSHDNFENILYTRKSTFVKKNFNLILIESFFKLETWTKIISIPLLI